jgi:DNA polymerase/3'-5' exonuclease PolX
MKMKAKIPLEIAEQIARQYAERLQPFCDRLEIAGSIRRRKAEVGDIEIVALPKPFVDLFGNENGYQDPMLAGVWVNKAGRRYKQYALPEGVNLDLFIVLPPAQWGVIFALRTGGAEFSRRLVTPKPYGYLPREYVIKDGAVHRADTGEIVPTPEEEDFLALCGVANIPPQERN